MYSIQTRLCLHDHDNHVVVLLVDGYLHKWVVLFTIVDNLLVLQISNSTARVVLGNVKNKGMRWNMAANREFMDSRLI